MKKKPIVTDMLNEARRDLAEVLEEMGAVAMHLREAMDAGENGNASFAAACVEDAQSAIDNARLELTRIRDKSGRWAVWAEGLDSQNDPSSATRPAGRNDCNSDAHAGFAAAHG